MITQDSITITTISRADPSAFLLVGRDFDGVDLVLLDADVAGLVQQELNGGLDDSGIAHLWARIADLDKIVPLINEEYCASYFTKLRTMAQVAAAPYIPAAT
ncbi:hypothetical protein ACGFZH_22140 [Streptomyces zaomyceticus]|uniref:hypothetical protein n=1 Tax=Streptomyces zaomyceticus TaxID=68286 RepID=UPI003718D733